MVGLQQISPQTVIGNNSIHHFKDHTNTSYTVVNGRPRFCPDPTVIRKLGVQLYCLDIPSPSPEAIANGILTSDVFDNHQPRVDIYTNCTTIEQCMAHHLREKQYRRDATEAFRHNATQGMDAEQAYEHLTTTLRGSQPLPHIVPSWCDGPDFWIGELQSSNPPSSYRSWILVLPIGTRTFADVLERGIMSIQFELSWSTAKETSFDEDPEPELSLLPDNYRNPWIWVAREPRPPEVEQLLLCIRPEPRMHPSVNGTNTWINIDGTINYAKYDAHLTAWKTPGVQSTFREMWRDGLGRQLWDCTYRNVVCNGCPRSAREYGDGSGSEHKKEECEWELDEHFFDKDGQCVECRRFLEYRRRSKRLEERERKRKRAVEEE